MREVVIVDAKRTAIGAFGKSLMNVSAVDLGVAVIKNIIKTVNLDVSLIDEVIVGNVLKAGLGQNVARQIARYADIPDRIPAFVIDKVCGSGLKAIELAAQSIQVGDADIVIAGGTENMSRAPYIDNDKRWGKRMGNAVLIDSMVYDGLTDAFDNIHMGVTAENIAKQYGLTREVLDCFAAESQNKAAVAIKSGRFADEIVPVNIPRRAQDLFVFDTDEYVRSNATIEQLSKLKPAFISDGVVTAGNASGLNDGAAFVLLMEKSVAEKMGLSPLARIVSYASAGVDPKVMGLGPIPASRKALTRAGLQVKDLDLVESNEAFASQAIAVSRDLQFDAEKTNVNGGAIALGHPIGASGARILVTLLHEMKKRHARYGLATLCIGGGQGTAMVVEGIYE